MGKESTEALFQRYFDEGTNKGDLTVIDEVFAPNYVHHDPANPDSIGGVDDVRFHIGALRGAFPDIRFRVDDMISEDDRVVVRWQAHLTHTGDYFGIPPTGKQATITGMNTWHVANGKAVEGWVNRDDLGLLQQLGVIPSPSAESGGSGSSSTQDANKALVLRNYEEIWNQGRLEIAEEIVDPNFHDHPPTRFFDVGRTGPASLQEAVRHFREAFSDFHDQEQVVLAEEDRVAYLGTISGTQDGDLFGFPPAGKGNKMRVRGINFFRLENGKIVERWGQFDVLTMMQQLGLAPSPGGPPGLGEAPAPMPVRKSSAADRERNKAVYRRMVDEVVNQGKFDVVDEIFDPAYFDHSAPPGLPGGLPGVKAVFGMFRTAFPDVKFTIQSLVADGDVVATLVEGTGTNTGPFMGMPPSNKPAKWRSVGFFRVTDKGQIVEHSGIPDMLGLLIQIGVIPPPPNVESAKVHD